MIVIGLTAATMVVEISAGLVFGSMALLADGLHMASHAVALGIAAFAYVYARRRARDPRFSFGTGKVNSLAGFTGAVLLAVFSLGMVAESLDRFLHPVAIAFDQAVLVAVLGLVVNGASALVLGARHEEGGPGAAPAPHHHHHHDHNLRSAYLHVLADALTSVLAILALLGGKHLGANWLDPAMGVVGALLVARWSVSLMRETAAVLLDRQVAPSVLERVRHGIEGPGDARVVDLHVWSIGPGIRAAEVCVEGAPEPSPDAVRARIPEELRIVHAIVEIRPPLGTRSGDR
jgi:cation diffusion facilitator family transporter